MFKKLSEEQINIILESGIEEFALHGLDKANINEIAKKAGVSVGVLYKYYGDKNNFFIESVRHSLVLLNKVLEESMSEERDIKDNIRMVLCALVEHAKKHSDYNVMYNEITSGGARNYAIILAQEIENISASVYTKLIENAKKSGRITKDSDSRFFAFFFDNLLMMLQFSYCCDYYKERLRIYCGEDVFENDEQMVDELMKFIEGALGL